jgi:hypothetical protein
MNLESLAPVADRIEADLADEVALTHPARRRPKSRSSANPNNQPNNSRTPALRNRAMRTSSSSLVTEQSRHPLVTRVGG